MNPEIAQKINELANDRLHGANWLSIQAINTLNLAIKKSQTDNVADFVNEIKMTAAAITKARPNMISIANYTSQLLNQIIIVSQHQKRLDYIKDAAQVKANELIKFARESSLKAAEYGAEIITDRDTIITCSYSSTVCKTVEIAKGRAIKFQVIIAESRYKDKAYGEISAEQLNQYQIPATLIHDEDINRYAYKANKALAGADTILADGCLINGTPTYRLAQAASEAKIPFYCICETTKFDAQNSRRRQPELEPGFDLIPSGLITGIMTEAGMIKPGNVANYVSRKNIAENYRYSCSSQRTGRPRNSTKQS